MREAQAILDGAFILEKAGQGEFGAIQLNDAVIKAENYARLGYAGFSEEVLERYRVGRQIFREKTGWHVIGQSEVRRERPTDP